jgi:redox-sensing transcriptional repressor
MHDARIPNRTVERLLLYRRLLAGLTECGREYVYSHELAALANVTPVQVRRDMMYVGHTGSPARGYEVRHLAERIGRLIDAPGGQTAVLVGLGNLGRALLSHLAARNPRLPIVAAFDNDPSKVDRVIAGCRCFHVSELHKRVRQHGVSVGIVAVPGEVAQEVANVLTKAGATALLNFAPVPLRVREGVFVEQVDITTALEKVAHYASTPGARPGKTG